MDILMDKLLGYVCGVLVAIIGLINMFWGNDFGFGIFLLLLSLIYFPKFSSYINKRIGIYFVRSIKLILFFFVIWAAVGVGELSYKITLMIGDFQYFINLFYTNDIKILQ